MHISLYEKVHGCCCWTWGGAYVAVRLFRGRWERVQHPDSLMNEAVTLSGAAGSEALVSPTRWRETEEAVWRDGWGGHLRCWWFLQTGRLL